MAEYSIVLYFTCVNNENIECIKKYINKGVLVYLFYDCFDDGLKDNIQIKNAIERCFLFCYKNMVCEKKGNYVLAEDGKIINRELYDMLCKDSNSEFNCEQYEIITAKSNMNYMVVSGAGTGKTTTMVNRLIYLRKTELNFTFDKVSLITFTKKASREIRERLINVLDNYFFMTKDYEYINMMEEVARCNISTIHSFAKSILNEYGKNIGINKKVEVKPLKFYRKEAIKKGLDFIYNRRNDLYNIIQHIPIYEIEDKLLKIWECLDNNSLDVSSQEYKVDFGKNEKGMSELICIVLSQAQEEMKKIKDYEVEISDLIKKLRNDELINDIKEKYKILMVDEFQDSDNVQIDFVADFCKKTDCKLFVVGDEKQSIYRFRGAQYTAFDKLKEKMKNNSMAIQEYHMTRNYRTNANLLKEINDIFINIEKKVDKFRYTKEDYIYSQKDKNKKESIKYIYIEDEGEKIREIYQKLLDEKEKNEYIAVLFRTNKEAKEFKKLCDRENILCHIDISGEFFRHEAVKDFYIMIKSLIDDDNNTMYALVDSPYIKAKINKKVILEENQKRIREYLDGILTNSDWNKYKKESKYISTIDLIDKIISNQNPINNYYTRQLNIAKRKSSKYKEIAYAKTLEYKLNLEHLIYILKDSFSDESVSLYTIEKYLKIKIATDNTIDIRKPSADIESGFLQCSTVHKVKGLEFDYVVIPNLNCEFNTNREVEVILRNEGNKINIGYSMDLYNNQFKNDFFSFYHEDEKKEIIGEETRLLYVALTRAKKKIFLNMKKLVATEKMNTWASLIGGSKKNV